MNLRRSETRNSCGFCALNIHRDGMQLGKIFSNST